jgi:hypothetical protein
MFDGGTIREAFPAEVPLAAAAEVPLAAVFEQVNLRRVRDGRPFASSRVEPPHDHSPYTLASSRVEPPHPRGI